MADDTKKMLERMVENQAHALEILVALATENHEGLSRKAINTVLSDHGYDQDDIKAVGLTDLAIEAIDDSVLDVTVHGKRKPHHSYWEITHVEVVFSTGGPHIELDTGKKAVMGYWGGDVARASVDDYVVDYFEGIWG